MQIDKLTRGGQESPICDRSDTGHVVSRQPCSHVAPASGGSGGRYGSSHQKNDQRGRE
uniref:Uncharacterized protein n=1 Tax=Oryza sativa subsp. japonica TaxID=39947 RepID=Q6ZJ57_ORYSJ|nr:hypothetical protein [Oryza sativa Japonica Group]BAD33107.1 hypothetical protein [Oryza sativa Japonica Group]